MSRLLLLAALMAWVLGSASPALADPAEDNAVKLVEKLGGSVQRDKKTKTITGVFLSKSDITDAGIKTLAGIKTMTILDLGQAAKLTDAGMKQVASLKAVTDLRLEKVPLTDAGLKELAALDLTSLDLNRTEVTDAGLKELAGLKSLKKLQLSNTKITDAGLKELAPIATLTFLDVSGSNVTDAGVKALKKSLPKCKILGPG